jgi:hypothetical protein
MSIPIFCAFVIITYRHYDDLSIQDCSVTRQSDCSAVARQFTEGHLPSFGFGQRVAIRKILSCEIGWQKFAQRPFSIQNSITGNCVAGRSGSSFTAVGANREMCHKVSRRPMRDAGLGRLDDWRISHSPPQAAHQDD